MDNQLASRLARWRMLPGTNDAAYLEMLTTPAFGAAMRQMSQSNLALAAADPAIDGINKDIGRFSATGLAMYLHASGGLTLPRLKEACAQYNIISPGRARALLIYLRFLRYVEPSGGGDRAALYVPTPGLMRAWRAITRASLEAAQVIEPATALLSNMLARDEIVLAVIRAEGELALKTVRRGSTDNVYWRVFLNRHAGMQILHRLMLSRTDAREYPPRGPLPFNISDLAREFRVSRPHVSRLLKAAQQEGLIAIDGATLTLSEGLRDHVRSSMGLRLASAIAALANVHGDDAASDGPVLQN
jgi:hypothetical protein